MIEVPISWESLEDAFENNAHEVHSYLHLETGEVIRVVDGVADPTMHSRIMSDPLYLRVDPVSSREQYRWMEHFIEELEEGPLKDLLTAAIDGKGAFRRFKDALVNHQEPRERWFAFRSARLRECMEAWLTTHELKPVERPEWKVPTPPPGSSPAPATVSEAQLKARRIAATDANRVRLHELVDLLSSRDLETALAFVQFLGERQALRVKTAKREAGKASDAGKGDAE